MRSMCKMCIRDRNEWAQHTIPIGLTAGHEYVGEVVEVGAGVQGFKVGDLVSLSLIHIS